MDNFSLNGVLQAEYEYNAMGHQTVRRLTQVGMTVHTVHDLEGNRIAEYDADTDELLVEYIWLNGEQIGIVVGGVTYYTRSDHIARPVFGTDAQGNIVGQGSWLPFGSLNASTGGANPLRFLGQWYLPESGLHQNWMRDYDPTTGRYLQGDPLGLVDGASVYGYALQSPGRYTDPRGEETTVQISLPRDGFDPGHASLIMPGTIFDPSGSCQCQFDEYGGPWPRGSDDTLLRNRRTDDAFLRYSGQDNWRVLRYTFDTTPEQEAQILDRIERYGGGGFLGCALGVSSVLDGIGPFKGLGTTRFPKRLNRRIIRRMLEENSQ